MLRIPYQEEFEATMLLDGLDPSQLLRNHSGYTYKHIKKAYADFCAEQDRIANMKDVTVTADNIDVIEDDDKWIDAIKKE